MARTNYNAKHLALREKAYTLRAEFAGYPMNDTPRAVVFSGGGHVDCTKIVLLQEAYELTRLGFSVLIGMKSFACLLNNGEFKEFKENGEEVCDWAKDKPGGAFMTVRGIHLDKPENFEVAVRNCKKMGITHIFITGGNGTAHHCAQISQWFSIVGIKVVFFLPCTIDGINGGCSEGNLSAVRVSHQFIERTCSSTFYTCEASSDNTSAENGITVIDVQGRDRDEIVAGVVRTIEANGKIAGMPLDQVKLIVLPATMDVSCEALKKELNTGKLTLVIRSEGSQININTIRQLALGRKVRCFVVGNQSQVPSMLTEQDERDCRERVASLTTAIKMGLEREGSFSVVVQEDGQVIVHGIYWWAAMNSSKPPIMAPEDVEIIKKYMP